MKKAAAAAALSAALLALPGSASAAVAPGHLITAFPQRDFVSAEGYNPDHLYTVEVQHADGTVAGTVTDVAPDASGLLEVNHPGGACWVGVTPDIRAGDVVRIVDQTTPAVDESTVRNVTAKRPVQTAPDTVQIHGTAQDALGNPLPIGELEQRLVAPGEQFLLNGKRQISATSAAGAEGTLSYDAPGSTSWTATYKGLLPADVDRALGAESRGMWLDPAVPSTETTIYENGAAAVAGPSAPCTAPLEKLAPPPGSELVAPSQPTGVQASFVNGSVSLNWQPASDNVGVTDYGVYRTDANGVKTAIATVQNPDGAAPAPTRYVDKNVAPGTYTYTIDAGDAVGNRSPESAGASAVATARVTAAPATNAPPLAPHSLIAFPARDFISADGYTPGTAYTFQVVRNGEIISTSTPIVADASGLAEVNHPGGACWEGVTPNIQAGDQVRVVAPDGTSDATTVAGVTAERPIVTSVDAVTGGGTIEVHGSAQDATGAPLPVDQIEQRLVAPNDAFDLNGRRTIRAANAAGEDGLLSYDAPGSTKWTARYTLQTPDDLARAVGGKSTSGTTFEGAESRVLWLGGTPAAGTELTIYENGPAVTGGPAAGIAGCTSGPAEIPAANALLSAAPKFADTAIGAQSAAQDITLTNGGDAPLHLTRAYLAGLNPGDFTITANPADDATVAPGASVTVSVAFKPTAAGTRQANLSFADDAANTTDQTVKLTATTPPAAGGKASAPVQSLATGQQVTDAAGKANSTIEVGLRWTATGTRSEIQMATGNTPATVGAFGAPPVGTQLPDGATSTKVALKMGSTNGQAYQFRVRSCDATSCGDWATGPAFTLQPMDETDMIAAAFKGNWTVDTTVAGAYGGKVRWAAGSAVATIVDRVQFTVTGNAAWVSTLGPDRGLAQVQVDNGKPEVVDLYSPTTDTARVVWARDALPPGQHTVTVTALGKKSANNPAPCNTNTKCARVDIDGSVMIK